MKSFVILLFVTYVYATSYGVDPRWYENPPPLTYLNITIVPGCYAPRFDWTLEERLEEIRSQNTEDDGDDDREFHYRAQSVDDDYDDDELINPWKSVPLLRLSNSSLPWGNWWYYKPSKIVSPYDYQIIKKPRAVRIGLQFGHSIPCYHLYPKPEDLVFRVPYDYSSDWRDYEIPRGYEKEDPIISNITYHAHDKIMTILYYSTFITSTLAYSMKWKPFEVCFFVTRDPSIYSLTRITGDANTDISCFCTYRFNLRNDVSNKHPYL
jgi:hypothetical protein